MSALLLITTSVFILNVFLTNVKYFLASPECSVVILKDISLVSANETVPIKYTIAKISASLQCLTSGVTLISSSFTSEENVIFFLPAGYS